MVPRPDIRARRAQLPAKVNFVLAGDIISNHGRIKTTKSWQRRTVPRYGSALNARTLTLAGRSDAACGDRNDESRCSLGYFIALLPSSLRGECHVLNGSPRFTRWTAKSSLGG